MSQSNHASDEVTTPLLQKQSLYEKLHAVKIEALSMVKIFYPLVFTSVLFYLRPFFTMKFLGCIDSNTIAGYSLALSFANMTAYSVFSGLIVGAETICSQAIGAKRYNLFHATILRGFILLLCTSLPVFILWINVKNILMMLKQDEELVSIAYIYTLYSTPDLLAQSILHPLKAYLRTQSKTLPLLVCTAIVGGLYFVITSLLVTCLKSGVRTIAMSVVLSNFILVALLAIYIKKPPSSDENSEEEESNHLFSVREWKKLCGLALPSVGLVCVEWWFYEIITVICGFLKEPKVAVASIGILIQFTSFVYIFPHSLSSAVSTRVGNELGSNRPQGARKAAIVGLVISIIIGIMVLTFTVSVRNKWATFFTDDKDVIKLTSTVLPIVGLCELGNCPQTVACGVLKGSARAKTGAVINSVAFYVVGLVVGIVLAFPLGYGLKGLWLGMLAAQITCGMGMMVVVYRTDWELEAERAKELTSVDAGRSNGVVEDVEAEGLISKEEQSTLFLTPKDEIYDSMLN
ncbi:unnamed protein product [Eruca vesicaria subsp. sativa]|uniref:Protein DETOXIFICATION n=1 Tax=Eruca vesicaria subsp. sativa TaxID=29727 RepID=A0ABC8LHQ3_ERUVS|nr:unnamed protein product [Eruca vesicaria subsp. sativa]